ncbi:hypothetical protein B0H16DRAFT_1545870 [Mycena metata]|uniref:Uncharacterized protein n=1 Tax=Mycena metata TaxID=1033252 RepID=A0AAD7NAI7_9AGAR|nr:hypothetical protein B0H16DRAFT_1545870 [Mycena metata]
MELDTHRVFRPLDYEESGADIVRERILCTNTSIIQLVDTVRKSKYTPHPPAWSQYQLSSEMNDLLALLGPLGHNISTCRSSSALRPLEGPLRAFEHTMKRLLTRVGSGDGQLAPSKLSLKLTQSLWNNEVKEYQEAFEQFKASITLWMLLGRWPPDVATPRSKRFQVLPTSPANRLSSANKGKESETKPTGSIVQYHVESERWMMYQFEASSPAPNPRTRRSIADVLFTLQSVWDVVPPLLNATLSVAKNLDPSRPTTHDYVAIGTALSSLVWMLQRCRPFGALPKRVQVYATKLTDFLTSLDQRESGAPKSPPSIVSDFLADEVNLSEILINDFDERQLCIPTQLCKSWQDLCFVLAILHDGYKSRQIIENASFGLRPPNSGDCLLVAGTWDSWLGSTDEVDGPLDLYAIMQDESGRCPHCKVPHPDKRPLPHNLQQCAHCEHTFLEVYWAPTNPMLPDSSEEITDVVQNIPLQLQPHPSHIRLGSTNLGALSLDSEFIPDRVLVIRHSKPVRLESEPETALPLSTEEPLQIITAMSVAQNSLVTPTRFHVLDIAGLFGLGLPGRYFRHAPREEENMTGDRPCPFNEACKEFYMRCIDEWTMAGTSAAILFGVLYTTIQIPGVTFDPAMLTVVQLSTVCLFFGTIYTFILTMAFKRLAKTAKGVLWIREAKCAPRKVFWDAWIMLALPLAWISWGVFYFGIFIMTFLWRSGGATQESGLNNPKPAAYESYVPRVATSFTFALGVVYLMLTVYAVWKI